MRARIPAVLVLLSLSVSGPGSGSASGSDAESESCLSALDELGVDYGRAKRPGIDIAVEVHGHLGGVELRSFGGPEPLVLDCSLVYSLARAGELFRAHGVERITYSSAYQRRNVRGTSRPSRHSFGLAIDVHSFALDDGERVAVVKSDYEQGLGDDLDCVGEPLTTFGRLLRGIDCGLASSGLFRIVLTPDYDADHYNHFHVEALPWRERTDR
ncbi:MAG TPA: extensin family protein [Kofleriaceae bacterium]|nr:extensin family protein [Kofleriaceae bacterium]